MVEPFEWSGGPMNRMGSLEIRTGAPRYQPVTEQLGTLICGTGSEHLSVMSVAPALPRTAMNPSIDARPSLGVVQQR